MARGYSFAGPNQGGSSASTMANVIATTAVRPRVFDIIIGSQATPADQAALYALSRFTAVGTAGSSPTPNPLDPADVACIATAGITHSAEPTYTSGKDLLNIPLNERASFRYVCSPGYEFVSPATANNGLGARLVSATASLTEWAQIFFYE